ncbi:hypothetical protein [Streptomyces sudanensis]|nr:hypothetical protein [Streptomyces sudanensis]MCP9956135.1 hypothetical protein [Streptomyces sudanensis]
MSTQRLAEQIPLALLALDEEYLPGVERRERDREGRGGSVPTPPRYRC